MRMTSTDRNNKRNQGKRLYRCHVEFNGITYRNYYICYTMAEAKEAHKAAGGNTSACMVWLKDGKEL